ncbi:MAG: phosphoribosylamine--glycine ligase, partial [Akkermansia sp.]|nr:phosphoribosylamine--glycine ligase [Akkermansia sp.]
MKIAVIGKGGREQALVETLAASPCKPEIYTFPGSDAILQTATAIKADGLDGLMEQMTALGIDLCVAGEESYLVKDEGLANRCHAAGIPCWGP